MSAEAMALGRSMNAEFFATLGTDFGINGVSPFVSDLTFSTTSNQAAEVYRWLGHAPTMTEWKGPRGFTSVDDFAYTIANKDWSNGIEIAEEDFRRQQHQQFSIRTQELADQAGYAPEQRLLEVIEAGETAVCYDGLSYFHTAHIVGKAAAQSNDLTFEIASGTATLPNVTTAEATQILLNMVVAMLSFKNDQNQTMNRNAKQFTVLTAPAGIPAFQSAINDMTIVDGSASRTNQIANQRDWTFKLVPHGDLTWTDKVAMFRTDARVKPFIFQEEVGVKTDFIDERATNKVLKFGASRAMELGYGRWEHAVLTTLTT